MVSSSINLLTCCPLTFVALCFLAFTLPAMAIALKKKNMKVERVTAALQPPSADKRAHVTEIHGHRLVDDYHWLRERESPAVREYLEAENRYTEVVMEHTRELREDLFQEMLGRIRQDDSTAPYPHGEYLYYTRSEEGKQYQIHCRKRRLPDAPEEVLLDLNELAKGHDFLRVASFTVSPNHRLLAYSIDTRGYEQFTIYVKDLESGELLPDRIEEAYVSLEWGNDNQTLFYDRFDATNRPDRIFRHRLGAPTSDDELLYHEADEAFHIQLGKTRDERFLLMLSQSNTTSEIHVLDVDQPGGALRVFQPRRHEVEYDLAHHGNGFYVLTNDGAKNFKLMLARDFTSAPETWETVIPHRPEVKLESILTFQHHLVLLERHNGLRKIRVRALESGDEHFVEMPERLYSVFSGKNHEYKTRNLRFVYQSLVTPQTVFDYDMETRERHLRKQEEVVGGYVPSDFVTERIYVRAADGVAVPVSLVYRKGLERNGESPCLLSAYGSYGASREPTFSSHRLSLLEHGFIFAIAHVRGGSELGKEWHEQGRMLHKRNSFTDFIAAAEHLIDQGYSRQDRLAIQGGSAGGLLIGAVVNLRPDLFSSAIADVPFVDVVNTMLDPTIPLTVIEYEEWGNPNDRRYFEYMRSYSPYDNVAAQRYPHLLVNAGLNDSRVHYWEPAKWVAKLRTSSVGDNRLLLKTNMGAGHGGSSGRYDALRELAFDYAFLLDTLNSPAE